MPQQTAHERVISAEDKVGSTHPRLLSLKGTMRVLSMEHPMRQVERPRTGLCGGRSFRGQSTVEYAVLIAVLVGALIAMQVYLKRGMSGHLRNASDSIGEQYAPGKTTSNYTLEIKSNTKTESKLLKDTVLKDGTKADVMETTTTINSDTTKKTGGETVDPLGTNLWN